MVKPALKIGVFLCHIKEEKNGGKERGKKV